jgi:uncharacterized protein
MSRVVHFEILAQEPEKLVDFYRDVFGWETQNWSGGTQAYWLVTTGSEDAMGINGGIMGPYFPQSVINTIQVDSVEATLATIERAGGKKVHGPNDIPGVGIHAYCSDPQGVMFGILQPPAAES